MSEQQSFNSTMVNIGGEGNLSLQERADIARNIVQTSKTINESKTVSRHGKK